MQEGWNGMQGQQNQQNAGFHEGMIGKAFLISTF